MIIQKGLSFFLLPVYTYYLSPSDYGILGVVTSISSFLSVLMTLGVSGAATRFYYLNDDATYRKKLFGTVSLVIICNILLFGSLFIGGHHFFIDPVIGSISFYPYIMIGLLTVIVTPFFSFYQDYLITSQNGVMYGINSMSFFILNVVLILICLCYLNLGVMGVLLANLITSFVFFIYVIIVFLPQIIMRIDKTILRQSLKYSLPLVPHSLANWSNGTIDKLLVNGIKSQSDAGLYNLGQQYGSVMNSVAVGINQAYTPWFYDKVNSGITGYKIIKKTGEGSAWLVALVGLILAIFSKELLGIMVHNPAYADVWRIVPCIVFAYVFQSLYFFFVNVLFLKDTKYIFFITIASVILNVVLNLLLIPTYGFMGCAIVCLFTYFSKSIFALVLSIMRNKDIRYRWISMYCAAFLALSCSFVSVLIENVGLLCSIMLKLSICCMFAVFVIIKFKVSLRPLFKKLHNN